MNAKAKGTRLEHRSRALLEAAGYQVVRAAGSLGDFDLVGIGRTDFVLVQVKSERLPGPLERAALAEAVCPPNTRKLLHRWRRRQRQPDVMEF
jgi:Holliday junction resolvase-like predicted endonuclease